MNASRRSFRIAGLFAAALVSGATLAAQDLTLRYRWTKGEEMRYRNTVQTDMQMSGLPGMGDMNVSMTMVQVNRLLVEDVAADGTATIRSTYESIKMTMSVPMMGDVTYDSTQPQASSGNPMADAIGKTVGALAGETFTMAVAPNGNVGKIDGLARLVEKTKAGASATGSAMGMGNMDAFISEEGQRSMIEQSFTLLPDKPVKAGEAWKNEFKVMGATGSQVVSAGYTLTGQETVGGHPIARVATTGTIKPGPAGAMGPMSVTMADGTSQGEMLFDVKLGRIRKATGTSTQPLSMRMTAPDGTDISIQAVQKTTATMELVEK
jgi:hypothetical protein